MVFDRSYTNTTKKYRATPNGKKSHRKSEWKTKHKIIFYDFDAFYERFENTTTCELCDTNFTSKNKKSLDHDHLSGYARFVCCNRCNCKLGRVDRLKMMMLLDLHRSRNIKSLI